ncbi:MAG: TetR/AcrR family transcriptional regulator [Pseudomonadota bacterium]
MDEAETLSGAGQRSATERRIVGAARELFMRDGFAATSTDALCKAASVSKTSIYKYFGNMVGVFTAVVAEEGDLYNLGADPIGHSREDFLDTLSAYGDRLLTLLNNELCIQLDRTIHEEARGSAELARSFYDAAYGRGHREVGAMIGEAQRKGFVYHAVPAEDLADNLISMWEGLRLVRARLGLTKKPFENPKEWSRHCVNTLFAVRSAT